MITHLDFSTCSSSPAQTNRDVSSATTIVSLLNQTTPTFPFYRIQLIAITITTAQWLEIPDYAGIVSNWYWTPWPLCIWFQLPLAHMCERKFRVPRETEALKERVQYEQQTIDPRTNERPLLNVSHYNTKSPVATNISLTTGVFVGDGNKNIYGILEQYPDVGQMSFRFYGNFWRNSSRTEYWP